MTEQKTITINGVGSVTTINVEGDESLGDALLRAGFDPSELDVSVNGESVESPDETPAASVEEAVATPKEAKLG